MRNTRRRASAASLASSLLILTLGLAPAVNGADHLDSPVVAAQGSVDITDVYAFTASSGNATVFIVGVNPGAGALPNSGTTFGSGVDYKIKVDTNGDLIPDIHYLYRFGAPNGMGVQSLKMWRNGVLTVNGWTDQDNLLPGGGRTTAGLYDDPFFFDLAAFQGAVLMSGNGRTFCDGGTTDFFLGLNLSAIVLRVPNSSLGGNGVNIGIWATTEAVRGGKRVQLDQMGRPAINTVFNNQSKQKQDRDAFNRTQPSEMVTAGYRDHAEDVLTALGAANPAGLAAVLFPDVLTFQTGNMAGFLNGRRLANDVIDAELGLVTNNGITTDCIANDSAFPGVWPYLAPANP
ncbi:MAG: hypothetical protein QOJ81_1306 [Chloroflexota bacterium]|jgi:hypothetical protein|nr:hypothetical protein [Chloroflexota bacterium]